MGGGRACAHSGLWKAIQAPAEGRGKGLRSYGVTESEMQMDVDWFLMLWQCALMLVRNMNTTKEES